MSHYAIRKRPSTRRKNKNWKHLNASADPRVRLPNSNKLSGKNLRDLLSVLAIGLAFPSIDTLFGRYRFEVIARGELWRTYEELFREGVLAEGNAAVAIPGPNWEIPEFMSDKRYEE